MLKKREWFIADDGIYFSVPFILIHKYTLNKNKTQQNQPSILVQ